ncbi:MAG TPA: AraC family transcriptional regulator [Cyclobacteriaceae bacterium]|nr:AraC family transcriptional regulator [Cyclobacteriaceae bacterium]
MKAQYEKIHPQESNSFRAYSYEKAEFDTPWHYHPEYELTYILSGRGIRYVGNGFENFEENDLVLLGPNLPHCWRNVGTQTGNSGAIVMHWENDLLGNKKEFEPIAQMFARASKGLKFNRGCDVKERLLAMLQQQSFEKLLTFLSVLNDLATKQKGTTLSTASVDDSFQNHDHQRINTVYQFVRNRYQEKVTLAEIASEVHMSEEAFSRFFSKVMNKPFFTFLNEYRINAACQLLIETDQPVAEVAMLSGFETLPFFYRQFGKFKKLSPKKYRDNFLRASLNK